MTLQVWLYYLLAVLILTASPGPSSLLCMSKSVLAGWRVGAMTALGSLTAITIIMTLSFTGLGVIIASSELIFNIIKWLGAGYLIYLGIKSLLSKQTSYKEVFNNANHYTPEHQQQYKQKNKTDFYKHYLSGFMVGASNPKAILFFTALFPQFINPNSTMLPQYLIFVSTFVVLELSWLLFYSYMGASSSAWLLKQGRAKLFNRLTGVVFIGAGLLLSTSKQT
ncbi:LysE family translocator [Psychrobacter sp. I-STPA6b]|uniref:LysE family translocator n=1 Tax=Psychrobacter sp. I-STPA6b TaxID=2585718 RepID=UPI001D0C7D98|nr:LysE family translocator [Psychrobacter sp. I-STPA6b]